MLLVYVILAMFQVLVVAMHIVDLVEKRAKEIDGENAENLLPDEYKTLTLKQLNKKISDAIENEDYELAAKLRDEINQRK